VSSCPDSGVGRHYWVPELVPHQISFASEPEPQIEPMPIFAVCRFCGEVQ
jgi:hypothetical protein